MTSQPHLQIAIAVIYHRDSKQILVTYRPEKAHAGGVWEFPGGKLEAQESPAEAAQREVLEETGADIEGFIVWDTHTHHYPERTVTLHICLTTVTHKPALALPTDDVRWVDHQTLQTLPMPAGNKAWVATLPTEPTSTQGRDSNI